MLGIKLEIDTLKMTEDVKRLSNMLDDASRLADDLGFDLKVSLNGHGVDARKEYKNAR